MTAIANLPWGIYRVSQIFCANVLSGLPDGRWVRAIPLRYDSIRSRIIGAWWVLTGRAVPLVWPEPGEIDEALGLPTERPGSVHLSSSMGAA